MKKFVFVIVNYNCSSDTIETISSIETINYKDYEIFILDNFSNEEDFENLKNKISEKYTIFRSLKNLGFAGGNNYILKKIDLSKFEYVILLNPDTLIEDKDFLNTIEREMVNSSADILGPLIRYYPDKNYIYFAGGFVNKYLGLTIMKNKGKLISDYVVKSNFECDFITGCCMVLKSKIFSEVGYLPEDYFLYFEETDFCLKSKIKNKKIIFTPKTFIYHKVSKSIEYMSETYLYYMIRNFKIFIRNNKSVVTYPTAILFYYFVWVPSYLFLCLKNLNFKGIKAVFKGVYT